VTAEKIWDKDGLGQPVGRKTCRRGPEISSPVKLPRQLPINPWELLEAGPDLLGKSNWRLTRIFFRLGKKCGVQGVVFAGPIGAAGRRELLTHTIMMKDGMVWYKEKTQSFRYCEATFAEGPWLEKFGLAVARTIDHDFKQVPTNSTA